MTIVVHHLEKSRSHRILWLLEELGAPYEIKEYKRDPKTQLAPRELKEIHPLGKSPVITEGDLTIAETGAIVEYLLDRFDNENSFRPAQDSDQFLSYRYWMHYSEGSAAPPLLLKVVFDQLPKQAPFLAKPLLAAINKAVSKEYINPQVKNHLQFWESKLSTHPYLVGENFTAADIQMSFAMEGALLGAPTGKYTACRDYLKKIKARKAFAAAEKRGGEFSLDLR